MSLVLVLHQSDNQKLINSLINLRDIGNSIIVVEHDRDMILNSDHIIDIGPFAGKHGGEIIFSGNKGELLSCDSLTAQYINNKRKISIPKNHRLETASILN